MKIGIGYDVHKLDYNRKLILGGVSIPHEKGTIAHSDGDCLVHAIIDALLGAADLYDIGTYFPDCDSNFKNANSLELLYKAYTMVKEKNFYIVNIDSVVVCERPKLKSYIDIMKENISKVLGISESSIGIKATTSEKLGFIGEEKGIACHAVCLICKNKNISQLD